MANCIVKNEIFEPSTYSKETPGNLVLTRPFSGNNNYWKYILSNFGIEVRWLRPEWPKEIFTILYKETTLVILDYPNVQSIADFMNKFNSISKSELEELVLEAQEQEKTDLEIDIEKLKVEKAELEEQMKVYVQIQTKKKEIEALIEKLK